MKLNPQQAPLYGQCVLTVQLADKELAADEEGVDYFLLFAGSTQRHLTSTLRSSHDTLQAVCPAHDCCEEVLVTLCSVIQVAPEASEDPCLVRVAPLSEHQFTFVQDLAFDVAQFLVSTAGRTDALDGALLLDECQIPLQECERLDENLALALQHLVLPPGWSLLGNKLNNSIDLHPQETLLHFSARRGLFRVTHFLLQQPGAREALGLANRQGQTPSTIAALRGHERLRELLTKADTDTEKGTKGVHRVPSDARVICHLPRLNTHSLTLRIHPGHELPTLQKSVEQLLHLICHLHAKGVSALELQFDCLHTSAECCDGLETEITCVGDLQQPATALKCSATSAEGSWAADYLLESGSADLGHSESGNTEKKDWRFSVSTPTSEVCPEECVFGSTEEPVCFSSNTQRDNRQTQEEGREQPVVSTQSLSLCHRSEGAQSEAERTNLTVGIPPPTDCGKQAVETDKGEAVIQEGQEATKGEERSEPEEEQRGVKGREVEEESHSESITLPRDTKASLMGLSLSSESLEVSDNSDSVMKDCSQEEDTVRDEEEEMKLCEELCDRLSSDEEQTENEGLSDLVPSSRDHPSPSLIDCSDVIEQPESALSQLLIEGLHKREPPPDMSSLEQNQETAGRDYATAQQQQQGLAPLTNSGNCIGTANVAELDGQPSGYSIENAALFMDESDHTADDWTVGDSIEDTRIDEVDYEQSPDIMASSGKRHADGLSSDDEGSFQSVGSSSTEIFHTTKDDMAMQEQDLIQSKIAELSSAGSMMEESSDIKPVESEECMPTVNAGLLLEPASDIVVTSVGRSQTGSEPESQLPPCPHIERTGENLVPKVFNEDPSLDPELSENEVGCDLNADIGHSASEVTSGVTCTVPFKDDSQSVETCDKVVVASGEESGPVQYVQQPQEHNHLQMTADERSPDEGLSHPGNQICVPSSTNLTPLSVHSAEVEPPSPNNEESSKYFENNVTEMPQKLDTVDGAWENNSSAVQVVDVIKSEDGVIAAGEEENRTAEETNFSTIHRDKEATFHQPYSTQHSGSSQSSAFPSLTSRTDSTTSCPSTSHRDSGSDIESFLNTDPGYDGVLRKNDEQVTGGDSTSEVSVSCSSTDDTASVGPSSSSPEGSQGLGCSWSPEEVIQAGATTSVGLDGGVGGAGEAEEEAKDRVSEVPRRSCLFRNSNRSLSPLRRHSWGPGKNNGGDAEMNQRSYSLEGLSGVQEELRGPATRGPRILEPPRMPRHDSDDRGSLVSLTEEQEELGEHAGLHDLKSRRYRPLRNSCSSMTLPLTKSVSMLTISQRDIDSMRSFSSNSGSLAYSISEEEPGPLRTNTEEKSATKVSRTFSYLKNKMYKKTREKDRDKREKDKEGKDKDKRTANGHVFTPVSPGHTAQCYQCNKAFTSKEAFHCTNCNVSVHKGCRDSLPVCAKVKMKLPKQQFVVPDSSSFPTVTMRNKSGGTRERPWSAILSPEDHSSLTIPSSRRPTSIMSFHGNNLSKSLSISNIAGPVFDEIPIKGFRYLSQSTDSLNRTNQVTESMESLTDEGTEMMDGQLMGEFEAEAKELEADSWSLCMEQQYLQQLDRELVKRQDVIYELMQTEIHHIRTLRIMSEVYSKGLQKEVQLELQTVEKLFPALDELLEFHTQHLMRLLERKRECQLEGGSLEGAFIINRIGDILVNQFSGSSGESMRRIYGRFCSRHNEAVNFYKDLLTKDKRFKAFIKKKMSSSIVRRLGIPECILLVTQRITKYPVLIQRMLQHTNESEEDFDDLNEAVKLVKEVIAAVDSKVNEHEKRRRLKDFHSRMDSKSIMMTKNGQIFAREDLLRRRLIHDGALQLKNSQGRLKDVHALLLSDVFVFLQEKDQKYVFAMLDHRSTVISLQKLIIREVANAERGLFLITAGIEKPEMIEVLASSKDERNTWMHFIQEAMQSMEKDEDEGIPSETEDDKRQLETKAKEMRDLLRQKDTEILSLLEEKVQLFRGMWEGLNPTVEACQPVEPFFRSASSLEPARGASIMKDALQEVEKLQALVNGSLGGAMASVQEGGGGGAGGGAGGGGVGPVCLPRRAETFGGFDSHQMHSSKCGDRDEGEDAAGDLRRTESDSVLKKGGNANLLLLLKRNSEQVLHSVSNLHLLLSTLQAVVVQQDSFIEEQRQALSERTASCASLSRPSSRPSSLIEQEKQRSLEKQRQELATLQRQQAAHAEEKKRREKEWELREHQMTDKEVLLHIQEEEVVKQHKKLEEDKQELQSRKEEYQKDLERLRDAQRKLERDREAVQQQLDKMEQLRLAERTPSTTSDESHFPGFSPSLEPDLLELSPSSSSSLPRMQPQQSKPKGKSLNPFFLSSTNTNLKGGEANNQISKGLLHLAKSKSKEGKEKKKKKGKAGSKETADLQHHLEPPLDGEIFFC